MKEETDVKYAFVRYYTSLPGETVVNRCGVKPQIISEGSILTEA